MLASCADPAETPTGNAPGTGTNPVPGNTQAASLEEEPTYQYTGTAQTIDSCRALIWEFADSEAFYLDGDSIQPWPAEMEGKEITIDGILVQKPGEKSVIKRWKILN